MKIAIPVFQTKISPRFDSAQSFILLQIEKNNVMKREKLPTKDWPVSAKIRQLADLGVDTLICGGIDLESLRHLNYNGIKIYSWITGEVEDAITCYLNKGLESGIILGNRGRRKGRWRFCTAGNHFCNMAQPSFKSNREGVKIMPKGDGSGPRGKGAGNGKGPGCAKSGKSGKGAGRAKGGRTGQCRAKSAGNSDTRRN